MKKTGSPKHIILKAPKGTLLNRPTKCDECQTVKPCVTQYPKSNQNYRVNICSDCAPRVLSRSFPRTRPDNSREDEYIWKENFDNDDLEIPSDDAMNRSLGGAFESNSRKH